EFLEPFQLRPCCQHPAASRRASAHDGSRLLAGGQGRRGRPRLRSLQTDALLATDLRTGLGDLPTAAARRQFQRLRAGPVLHFQRIQRGQLRAVVLEDASTGAPASVQWSPASQRKPRQAITRSTLQTEKIVT